MGVDLQSQMKDERRVMRSSSKGEALLVGDSPEEEVLRESRDGGEWPGLRCPGNASRAPEVYVACGGSVVCVMVIQILKTYRRLLKKSGINVCCVVRRLFTVLLITRRRRSAATYNDVWAQSRVQP